MTAAAEMTIKVRRYASDWVEREERSTGSRMAAYERVASTVGASADWLRKFIKGSEAKQPRWDIGCNIIAHYERICERVEAKNEQRRAIIEALEGRRYAADPGFTQMVATGARRTSAASKPSTDDLEIPEFLRRAK